MTIQAVSADGVTHEFPDGTDPNVIGKVMKDYALKNTKTAAPTFKFSDSAITNAQRKPGTSTVFMKPDQYLALTPDLPDNPRTDRKGASLQKSLAKGDDVDELPSLDISVGKDGSAKVIDQDGRHRALFAKQAGVDLIPVAVKRGGDQGASIKTVAGMKDGSDPVTWDFRPVPPPSLELPGQTPKTAPAKPLPRWDVLGDIGRAAEGATANVRQDIAKGFPDPNTIVNQNMKNDDKYGTILGGVKSTIVDPAVRMGNALKAPLDAVGILASPITGTVNAVGGSGAAALMDKFPIKGDTEDHKAEADRMVDQALALAAPETGTGAGLAAGDAAVLAAKNAAKRANLKPVAEDAIRAGYKFPPQMVKENPSRMEQFASGGGGRVKMRQAASAENQPVTNSLAAEDLGLPRDTVLTDQVFKNVRNREAPAYQAVVSALPEVQTNAKFKDTAKSLASAFDEAAEQFHGVVKTPSEVQELSDNLAKVQKFTPKAGIAQVKLLRAESNKNLNAGHANPEKGALGMAQRKAADAIEDLIADNLRDGVIYNRSPDGTVSIMPSEDRSGLITNLRKARQMIAKSYDVEGATNTDTGDVSAIGLARLYNKGRPLTGNLKTIAKTANAFRPAVQNPGAFGGVEPFSVLDMGAAGVSALHGRPDIAGMILARPVLRNMLLSDSFQKGMLPDAISASVPPPMTGLQLLKSTPLPGVQNQLAQGIFRAAHVPGLRSAAAGNALRAALARQIPPPPQQGQ